MKISVLLQFAIFILTSHYVWSFVLQAPPFRKRIHSCHGRLILQVANSNNANNVSVGDDGEKVSIGDVVQGLHGGKYQFDDPQISGNFLSYYGQQFAESLYSSKSEDEDRLPVFDPKEPLPTWVQNLAKPPSPTNTPKPIPPAIVLDMGNSYTVQIQNSELSWERFYAVFVCVLDGGMVPGVDCPFLVEPQQGLLTPRGGRRHCHTQSHATASIH